VADTAAVLRPGGWLVVEMGAGQAGTLRGLVERDGRYGAPEIVRDGAGIERVLAVARRGG
jgi:methylase of polypeptide subunit release factors